MLSIILYGRNDNHGYNYHKRLAISINCLAALLTNSNDEIIFVDYNTPNDLPTAVEAIHDTLTAKARRHLKVFRVRPEAHRAFNADLPLLEPVARNVAIRRSNPLNKWILSTNVDMVFVPQEGQSLTGIVQSLKEGFYLLPRYELPENLWEKFLKRSDPEWNLQFLQENGLELHLNTIVRKKGFIQFDNPGDFQLMLRKDVFEIGGFDEEMQKGWHVDSNLTKRMLLHGKPAQSIENKLWGYHCNHTRTDTLLHRHHRTENDWGRFVEGSGMTPFANPSGWGLENVNIEQIILGDDKHFIGVLESLKDSKPQPYEIFNDREFYNRLTYDTYRIFAYVADHLCNIPKTSQVVYIGCNAKLVQMLKTYLGSQLLIEDEIVTKAAVYIFDFGFDGEGQRSELKKVMKFFLRLMGQKNKLNPDAKFIGINVNHSDFLLLFLRHLSVRLTSRIAGCAYGYLRSSKNQISLIHTMGYFVMRYLFRHSERISRFVRGKIE